MAGIYIHIPFCKQACHYCDFHFSTNTGLRRQMVDAITKELLLQRNYLQDEPIKTIYFGGGTPSLLPLQDFVSIFNALRENFSIDSSAEITLEANPDDLSTNTLKDFKAIGINRLSIGIQSFDDVVLKFLNRPHNGLSAIHAVDNARAAGFDNISIDLIYAIPDQHDDTWRRNILQTIALRPEHISSYSLTIENKTAFGNWYQKGKLHPVTDDRAAHQLEMLVTELNHAGYEQYEVSNFSKPGYYSKHNSSYWRQQKYLGVGPSAHSYNVKSRQYNVSNNQAYITAIGMDKIPCEIEILSAEDRINDYLLTTLRTKWGADLRILNDTMGYNLHNINKSYLNSLLANQLAIIDDHFLILTPKGLLLADKISSDLFVLPDKQIS